MQQLLSTKEVAKLLGVNEKMIYTLINEKSLPATKITGKWLFPRHLVEQWVESRTINFPRTPESLNKTPGLIVLAGSNDPLFERTLGLFMRLHPECLACFANLGSLGGLKALRRGLCHAAVSHLMQGGSEGTDEDYNFTYAETELNKAPAVINFSRRRQGLILAKGNPKGITSVADLGKPGIRLVNRSPGTGTRLLLEYELAKADLPGEKIDGFDNEVGTHLAVGLEVLSGRADAGMGIEAAAGLLGLDFLPIKWERFDLLIPKEHYFNKDIQSFLDMLQTDAFKELASSLAGYDLSLSGKILYPRNGY